MRLKGDGGRAGHVAESAFPHLVQNCASALNLSAPHREQVIASPLAIACSSRAENRSTPNPICGSPYRRGRER